MSWDFTPESARTSHIVIHAAYNNFQISRPASSYIFNFSLLHLSLDCNFLSLVQSSHDPNLERKSFSQRLYRESSAYTRQHGHLNPLPQTGPRLPHLLLHRSAHGLLCVSTPLSLPICIVFSALVTTPPYMNVS